MLGDFQERLKVLELDIDFTKESKTFLMDKGFDPALGARPLRRAIQQYLEDPLSELLLQRGFKKETEIRVDVNEEDGLDFEIASK